MRRSGGSGWASRLPGRWKPAHDRPKRSGAGVSGYCAPGSAVGNHREGGATRLDVLVCTHNRAALLRRVIESLNAANRPSDTTVRLVVVANACSDGTGEYLAGYDAGQGRLPLTWYEEPVPGKAHALNVVLPRLTGDLVAFVDDDHRVDPGYLCAVARGFAEHPDAAMLCGRIRPDWDGSEPVWVHDRGAYRIYPLPVPNFDLGPEPREVTRDVAVPGGGNLAIRRALFDRVGPFRQHLGPIGHNLGGAEDIDWVIRALQLGVRLRYEPAMTQYHYVDAERLTLGYLMRKAYQRSASMVPYGRGPGPGHVPRYMYRKIAKHLVWSVLALRPQARRFHLVRLAASLGEWKGFRQPVPAGLDQESGQPVHRDAP
ncbi:glycosyltransferase [Spiribacter halobius]|uniref:glycosyltransferase n=1 Tax=Sediminicurvatus halobius TaxID=2182432 RepID=UPI001E2F1EB4|nr:glycosyltransferase family 2 protein [Spiribacter halobius]UEX77325.1 glycosyltransferase family 2 protein [Spiribacter halobius]